MNKRVVVFINGLLDAAEGLKQEITAEDVIVCADGGIENAIKLGYKPKALIGDLDSISSEALSFCELHGVEIVRYPREKDFTDLELALDYALKLKPSKILLVTALGGRLDHLLGNILILAHEKLSQVSVELFDSNLRAQILRANTSIALHAKVGSNLSILPLTSKVSGVCLTGTKWTLQHANLELGQAIGLSNVTLSPEVQISIVEGLLLVIVSD